MKSLKSYLKQLIDRTNPASSKSFFMLVILAIACFLYMCIAFVLIYDVTYDGQINTDLIGLSTFIGSVSTALGVAGVTKVMGEKNDHTNI